MWRLCAIDAGAHQTLKLLARAPGFAWAVETNLSLAMADWQAYLKSLNTRGLVVGTSRSKQGTASEAACRVAARSLNIPIVAIEDYPGNYQHVPGGEVGLLIVESTLAERAARMRLGAKCPKMSAGASFRYDSLRSMALGVEVARAEPGGWLLWAGQPETSDALLCLSHLLPSIASMDMKLLFRAHPRDAGHPRGDYKKLFAAYSMITHDVSGLPLEAVLNFKPCLTLTQFSSHAIELAFLGIPSVHVLFSDSGEIRLKALTGYGEPLVCKAGGSVKIASVDEIEPVLRSALFDKAVRVRMMQRFGDYFDIRHQQTDFVLEKLRCFFERWPNQKQVM